MAFTRAKGTRLQILISSIYQYVSQVEDLNRDRDGDTIETTNHDTTDLDRTYMAGLRSRTVSGSYAVDSSDTVQAALETAYDDGTNIDMAYATPDNAEEDFEALVTSLSDPAPIDGKMMREFELQVSGASTKKTVIEFATTDVTVVDDVINIDGLSGSDNDQVRLRSTGALPAGLTSGQVYFLKEFAGTDNYQFSLTSGGAAVTITDVGSGTHRIIA